MCASITPSSGKGVAWKGQERRKCLYSLSHRKRNVMRGKHAAADANTLVLVCTLGYECTSRGLGPWAEALAS